MTLPQKHFEETKILIKSINANKIAKWLLIDGYYPETYVLPPTFAIKNFKLQKQPYFFVNTVKIKERIIHEFKPTSCEIITISFPKSQLTERTFGIIDSRIYHDIVWYLIKNWDVILKHLFEGNLNIYSYSFPLPVSKKKKKSLGALRAGRMIYEFLEMAENDLVAEAHNFKFIVKTDIKNFYPSIYTHSISWALHNKSDARNDKNIFSKLGTKLDKLFQSANDGCTNGLPVGSAVSDLISEILLTSLDKEFSEELSLKKIKYIGVRFKDDYRFLCNSKEDANKILKALQFKMRNFNLSLNDSKSSISELPEGLYRPWTLEYQKITLRYKKNISYKIFENALLNVLKIDSKFPDTGVIDKFLSEIITKKYKLKLFLSGKQTLKTISLLLLLKERRAKSFPQILAIIEQLIIKNYLKKELIKNIHGILVNIFEEKYKNENENQYDLLWLLYLLKTLRGIVVQAPTTSANCPLINSLFENKQTFFNHPTNSELFSPISKRKIRIPLVKYLAIYP